MTRYARNFGEMVPLPPGYAHRYTKRMKKKEQYLINVQFLRRKSRNNARHCRTPMKSNIVSIGCYVWLLPTRLPANRLLVETLCAYQGRPSADCFQSGPAPKGAPRYAYENLHFMLKLHV